MSIAKRFGCVTYVIVALGTSGYFMMLSALGDCASDGPCFTETERALMFYGVPLIALISIWFVGKRLWDVD
ncbi:hypothetical protein [Sphingomicrobium marinum]|uniref:hypothetical protein n=1 Tax=Sphingomicrobium marinum TaxID=1227950 RepID=UPI00223F40FB|nr:hypothetical protein [Sphingomicrobium marinum]